MGVPWRRKWLSFPVFLPEEYHAQRSPVACSPWGSHKSQILLSTLKNHPNPWLLYTSCKHHAPAPKLCTSHPSLTRIPFPWFSACFLFSSLPKCHHLAEAFPGPYICLTMYITSSLSHTHTHIFPNTFSVTFLHSTYQHLTQF